VWPYAAASAATLAALLLALWGAPLASSLPPLLFLAAVAVAGWHGGLGPALGAAAAGALALDYFFETPARSLEVTDAATVVDLVDFVLVGILLGSLNARLRGALDQSEAARARPRRPCAPARTCSRPTPTTCARR
jgi:K+-sensing histidine kinase KdpD